MRGHGGMGGMGGRGGMGDIGSIPDGAAVKMSISGIPNAQTITLATDSGTADTSSETNSSKGIKSDSSVAINNGTLTIDSSDDAIHSNDSLSISNGTLEISSGDDGIHADASLSITGGKINITKSYEGIEGQSIEISGGSTKVTASDDGVNAAGGSDGSSVDGRMGQNNFASQDGVEINISGGTLNVNASGDGIDSNGSITVSGGETYVSGSANSGNAPLDYNGAATITGGIVVATGMSGMAQNFGDASTQGSMLVNVSNQPAGSAVTLKDSGGKTIASFKPEKEYNCVVVSAPDVKQGGSYTLVSGSAETSVKMDSLIYGGGQTGMGGGMKGGGRKRG